MKKILCIFSLALIIFLTSCQSFFVSSIPTWSITKPKDTNKWVYFVGKGEDKDPQLAKNKAYLDALQASAEFVGAEVVETYYRELFDTDAIAQFGMTVSKQYQTTVEDIVEYYVLFKASRRSIESNWSEDYKKILAHEEEIKTLLADSVEDYKNNNDVESVNKILKALARSLTFDIKNEELKSSVILEKALLQLSQIEINIKKYNPRTAEAEVKLTRKYGILHPPVKNAIVNASFMTYEPLASQIPSSIVYMTDNKGRFTFSPINPYFVKKGQVTFLLDMESELYNLSLVAPKEYLENLEQVISNIRVSFDYELEQKNSSEKVGISLTEYREDGQRLFSNYAQDTFISYFNTENTNLTTITLNEEEFDFILEEVKENYPEIKYLIWGRVGVLDNTVVDDEYMYSIGGDVYLIDVSNKTVIKEESLAKVSSFDFDRNIALMKGFEKYGKLLAVNYISNF